MFNPSADTAATAVTLLPLQSRASRNFACGFTAVSWQTGSEV